MTQENELLHDVFKFKPQKQQSGKELYVAERDVVSFLLFMSIFTFFPIYVLKRSHIYPLTE